MADTLNYQPSRSAVYYTTPQRLDLRRTLISFAIALVIVSIGSAIYAAVIPQIKNLVFRVAFAAGAALAVGVIGMIPVFHGRVRAPLISGCIGAAITLIAIYVMWVIWMQRTLMHWGMNADRALILNPLHLHRSIRAINAIGTWSLHNDYQDTPMRGWPLGLLWLGELGMFLAAGVLFPIFRTIKGDTICLDCHKECKPVKKLPRFGTDRQSEFLASIENRDFPALATHEPADHEDDPELVLRLLTCRDCGKTSVLTVNHIAWYVDQQTRKRTVRTKAMIDRLLITPEESEQLQQVCAAIQEQRASEGDDNPPEPATPVSEQSEDPDAPTPPDDTSPHL